jgi:hypothetical protein
MLSGKLSRYQLKQSFMKKIEVKHDAQPENEVIINAVWCDIGSHKVRETEMRQINSILFDASVCEDCYDHYN